MQKCKAGLEKYESGRCEINIGRLAIEVMDDILALKEEIKSKVVILW
jgi:hypothetical protein